MGLVSRCSLLDPHRRPWRGGLIAGTLAGLLTGVLAAPGCGGDESPADAPDAVPGFAIADACNPLGSDACLMPWPSAAYLRDAETATGVAVDLPREA